MSLADEYKRQLAWRDWASVLDALPPLQGKTVLDLGCGVGDQAAQLAARGARVIGLDLNRELLAEARARAIPGAEFHEANLRLPLPAEWMADGLWSSFAAAYFIDLPVVLRNWRDRLRPGGWVALTEIDDMFGHEPVQPRTKSRLDAYVRDALESGRYDFHMGRKLADHLRVAGFEVTNMLTLRDREFAFEGPAPSGVIQGWRDRFDRMGLLKSFCGADFEAVRDDFLECLAKPGHRSGARVCCCVAVLPGYRRSFLRPGSSPVRFWSGRDLDPTG